ncbi:hypothetical protein P8452_76442 [Trifolium repens]|nr:hypothetical protein P8452_76442 [Trifolium repens]
MRRNGLMEVFLLIQCLLIFQSLERAYDRAAIKFHGVDADINFNVSDYDEDIKQVCPFNFIKPRELCAYIATKSIQLDAARAYDKAAINFEASTYEGELISQCDNEGC